MKRKIIWVVVADGASARILKDVTAADIGEEIALSSQKERLGEIMADHAGRSFSSAGARRSAMELHSDPVREKEREFAAEIAEHLQRHLAKNAYDQLVVFAAPQTLGDLRSALPEPVKQLVVAEINKNLTSMPSKRLWETVRKSVHPLP